MDTPADYYVFVEQKVYIKATAFSVILFTWFSSHNIFNKYTQQKLMVRFNHIVKINKSATGNYNLKPVLKIPPWVETNSLVHLTQFDIYNQNIDRLK